MTKPAAPMPYAGSFIPHSEGERAEAAYEKFCQERQA